MTIVLDSYQEESRDFLLSQNFALLLDEMGVGKTAPAIMAGYEKTKASPDPVLVTCPAYLCDPWAYEIGRFTPEGTRVVVANGSGTKARNTALQADADFVITGYSNWSAKTSGVYTYPVLTERKWGALIFDEVHRLRGRNSNCTRHVLKLHKADNRNRDVPAWGLSGTPIVNNPGDLYPLFQLWKPRTYRSYWKFVNEWCHVVVTPWSTEVGQVKRGKEDEFKELVSQFAMRRTLSDIPSLATLDAVYRDYSVALPASVKKMIKDAKRDYIIEHEDLSNSEFVAGGGALYVRLRQLATDPPTVAKPKIDWLRDFLEDHSERLVVYAWYKDSVKAIAEGLTKTHRPAIVITGDVPAEDRQGLVDQWTSTPDGLLIATISSLKEGISLVAASTVVFLESSELPADMDQCVARLKRRGQTKLVNVYRVWARDSPDEAIQKAVENRDLGIRRALTTWLKS